MRGTRARILVVGVMLAAVVAPAGASVTPETRSAATWHLDTRHGAEIVATLERGLVVIPGSKSGPDVERVRRLDYAAQVYDVGAVASGDLDGDGFGDLLLADPDDGNRGVVGVVPGGPRGPRLREAYRLEGPQDATPGWPYQRRIGDSIAVGDVDSDGYDDLVTTLRGQVASTTDPQARVEVVVFWGGRSNLTYKRSTVLDWMDTPRRLLFGIGNVYGDQAAELIMVDPGRPATSSADKATRGSLMTCGFKSRRWPVCRNPRQTGVGITDIAVGDMVGGRHDDIVLSEEGGQLWVHRGTRDALANAATLTQASRGVPGSDETGDEFGASLVAADIGGSAKADLLVGAPGEDEGRGRVTVLYGHRAGLGSGGGGILDQDTAGIPSRADAGDRFGAAVSALDVNGDGDLDVVVGAPGEHGGRGTITVVPVHDGRLATRRAMRITLGDVTGDSYYHPDDNRALGTTIGR